MCVTHKVSYKVRLPHLHAYSHSHQSTAVQYVFMSIIALIMNTCCELCGDSVGEREAAGSG